MKNIFYSALLGIFGIWGTSVCFAQELSKEEKDILTIEQKVDVLKHQKELLENKTTDENYDEIYPLIQEIDQKIARQNRFFGTKTEKGRLVKKIEILKKEYSILQDKEILKPGSIRHKRLSELLQQIYTLEEKYEKEYPEEFE